MFFFCRLLCVFRPVRFFIALQSLMGFLGNRKGLACKISGKAALREASSTMGDYRAKLEDRVDAPREDNPGTFSLDTAIGQEEVSAATLSSRGGLFAAVCSLSGAVYYCTPGSSGHGPGSIYRSQQAETNNRVREAAWLCRRTTKQKRKVEK